jgi:hypothetical protein
MFTDNTAETLIGQCGFSIQPVEIPFGTKVFIEPQL